MRDARRWLDQANEKYGIHMTKEDIIRPFDKAIGTDGSVAVLKGNPCSGRRSYQTYSMPEGNVQRSIKCTPI